MRKEIKKWTMPMVSFVLTAALVAGTGIASKQIKAEDNLLTGEWVHTHESYELNDALINNTQVSANEEGGFTANISITGWQREWYGVDYMPDDVWPYQEGWCDNPYQLRSETQMQVSPKSTYELKFDIANSMTTQDGTNPTEKNVTITVNSGEEGDNENTMLFTTVRVPANGTLKFDRKFTVPETYTKDTVMVQIAYGAYAYSYEISASPFLKLMPAEIRDKYCFAPGTREKTNATGELKFTNMEAIQVAYEEPTTKITVEETTAVVQTTTKAPETTTKAITETPSAQTTGVTVIKLGKPSIKVKNLKGKKIKVTWKKVKDADKYQVRAVIGKKKIQKTTSKVKITLKGLAKKKTYKISVRAYNKAGYGKWSKVKKVKVKK